MLAAAEAERFEDAARLRDRLRAIEKTQERQQAVAHGGGDQDIFGFYREGGFIEAQVLFVRQGKLTGNQAYHLEDFELPDEEVVRALVTQFYQGERYVPDEILLPIELEDAAVRADYLGERKGRRVEILWPQRGDRVRLLEMARDNAAQSFRERQDGERQYERISDELRRKLHLRNAPKRIECVDISTFQGGMAVGLGGRLRRGPAGQERLSPLSHQDRQRPGRLRDDVRGAAAALCARQARAAVSRPARRRRRQGTAQRRPRGAARAGIDRSTPSVWRRCGFVRAAREAEIERSDERVFLPGRANPVVLRRNSNALFLLQRLRDEAHRFAITHHRKLRSQQTLYSALDRIAGIGGVRKRALLRAFGSVSA